MTRLSIQALGSLPSLSGPSLSGLVRSLAFLSRACRSNVGNAFTSYWSLSTLLSNCRHFRAEAYSRNAGRKTESRLLIGAGRSGRRRQPSHRLTAEIKHHSLIAGQRPSCCGAMPGSRSGGAAREEFCDSSNQEGNHGDLEEYLLRGAVGPVYVIAVSERGRATLGNCCYGYDNTRCLPHGVQSTKASAGPSSPASRSAPVSSRCRTGTQSKSGSSAGHSVSSRKVVQATSGRHRKR